MVCGPRREERHMRAGSLPPSLVPLPSPPHPCAPGSEIQTDSSEQAAGLWPQREEGGAGSQRRGRETAWRPINTSEWEVTRAGGGVGGGGQGYK